jgi:hypothetical protein
MTSLGLRTDFELNLMTNSLLFSQRQLLCVTAEKLNNRLQGKTPTRPALFVSASNITEHSAPVSENVADTTLGIRKSTIEVDEVTLIIVVIVLFPYSIADKPRMRTLTEYSPGVNAYADN